MFRIYENPVQTEVDLIHRISSVCVNIPKYVMYFYARRQRTLVITSSITMKSEAAGSKALANNS
jgi:hypothetical protein